MSHQAPDRPAGTTPMQGRTGKHSDAPSRTRLPGKFAMSHSAVADVLDRVEGRHAEPRPADAIGRAALATRLLLDTLLSHLGAVWLSAIILVVLGGVVSRYAFNNSFSWTEEAGLWLFTYLIFTALPIATHRSKHIAIPMLRDLLPPGGQAVVRFLAAVAVTYTIIRLLTAGATIAGMTSGSSITLNIPAWWQYAIIPASASLLLLYQVLEGLQVAETRRSAMAAIGAAALVWLVTDVWELTDIQSSSPTLLLGISFVVTLFLGVPVAYCMLFAAFVASDAGDLLPPAAVVHNVVIGSSKFVLLAIPLFIAAAQIMNAGGLTVRLIALARALVGHLRGGLAQVNVLTSVFFGFDSGSSTADASLLAKMTVPEMVRNGYPAPFCCAVIASAAVLPNVIPPSIAMLLFASITNVSVGKLFLAGILPGLLIALLLMGMVYVLARRNGYGHSTPRPGWRLLASPLFQAIPALLLSVLIIGGIRFGLVTATEAGVVAVVYALLVGVFFYRDLRLPEVWHGLRESSIDSAMVGFMIGVAAPFAWVLISGRVPQQFLQVMLEHVSQGWAILLILNAVMLIAGAFLDLTAIMLIVVPLAMPLILQLGVDPVHFGIVVVVNLMLGGLTPPYGLLVFIPSAITGTSVQATFRAVMPFFLILVLGLALITYVPSISLAFVRAFF
jgi:tripartite ATP-independent transporter DctM subunit